MVPQAKSITEEQPVPPELAPGSANHRGAIRPSDQGLPGKSRPLRVVLLSERLAKLVRGRELASGQGPEAPLQGAEGPIERRMLGELLRVLEDDEEQAGVHCGPRAAEGSP